MADIAIRADNLSKMYRIGEKQARYKTIRESAMETLGAPLRRLRRLGKPVPPQETIWALKDISFQVRQGEVLGIIGRNGSGKSTLLKVLSRITEPTKGRAEIYGRVGSLLEVGTGFHPELTGRENLYLNGAILGMTRAEIDRKFDEIVDFAEIEQFLDTPVKRYSSGMYVRLAFAVAAHLEPEILIVDEVLSVGDAQFQKKCMGKMGTVAKEGRTVLFVSHNMWAIRQLCGRVVWLKSGGMIADGGSTDVVDAYLASQNVANRGQTKVASLAREGEHGQRVRIQSCTMYDAHGEVSNLVRYGEPFALEVAGESHDSVEEAATIIGIDSMEGIRVVTCTSEDKDLFYRLRAGRPFRIRVNIRGLPLNVGSFSVTVAMRSGRTVLDRVPACLHFQVLESPYEGMRLNSKAGGFLRFPADWQADASAQTTKGRR